MDNDRDYEPVPTWFITLVAVVLLVLIVSTAYRYGKHAGEKQTATSCGLFVCVGRELAVAEPPLRSLPLPTAGIVERKWLIESVRWSPETGRGYAIIENLGLEPRTFDAEIDYLDADDATTHLFSSVENNIAPKQEVTVNMGDLALYPYSGFIERDPRTMVLYIHARGDGFYSFENER